MPGQPHLKQEHYGKIDRGEAAAADYKPGYGAALQSNLDTAAAYQKQFIEPKQPVSGGEFRYPRIDHTQIHDRIPMMMDPTAQDAAGTYPLPEDQITAFQEANQRLIHTWPGN